MRHRLYKILSIVWPSRYGLQNFITLQLYVSHYASYFGYTQCMYIIKISTHYLLTQCYISSMWRRVLAPTTEQQPQVIPSSFHIAFSKIKYIVFDQFRLLQQLSLLWYHIFSSFIFEGPNTTRQSHIPLI